LVDCKQLQEILELPPNIEEIYASGCVSLESFPEVSKEYQFNTSELQRCIGLTCPECYKMLVNIRNQVANSLLDKVCLSLSLSLSVLYVLCALVYGLYC
jgi:hypothetical protein